jgi:putative ABC transport system ATP-binding protein
MSTIPLEVRRLTKTYGKGSAEFHALRDVSLQLKAGESIAIVGKSGSGKSTLMHVLALLDAPSSGEVIIDGQATKKLKKKTVDRFRNQRFGFVFQQFFLNANATVLDNVTLPLKIGGVTAAERTRRGKAALALVELSDKEKNKAKNLSGGQKQRVVIARALINEPQVIFADEPTGNLDSATGAKIEDMLFDLQKQKGITLVIVTHDPDLAARCDRRIELKDGSIIS